jgi:hypothetical protein
VIRLGYTPPLALLVVLVLAGCGAAQRPASPPLGRSITPSRERAAVAETPAPGGDPPSERGGTIPRPAGAAQQAVSPRALAATPRQALVRYALLYVNWRAAQLPARERELAALSVGAARLTALATAAASSGAAALAASDVANSGEVIVVAPGEGAAAGQWVVVTQEQTTGRGAYAGLPPGPHVTLARVTREAGGWVVSAWAPAS